MQIFLEPIAAGELVDLEQALTPRRLSGRAVDGAMPPPRVATRALERLRAGDPERWCLPFYMRDAERRIVGACGFKGSPCAGRVEIGYSVAPACRGLGAAAMAVRLLLERARDSGEVLEVLAQINADNLASTRVAQKLGFLRGGVVVDQDDESLLQWLYPVRRVPGDGEERSGR
ncbi:GNAT family N-acetyltransferase [Chromobacterium sphagni]|uniref:N-acetyltransferase domain-containing protein n=1 Tax=Chromobacterium sphagni TaxID=1903179 RepID=A0ABX3CA55_9NEIS|nr:GNAT family N-acetyltransferase [Chromobacterium sphagni]OHX18930.1 hypothetical protein BI344_09880 [Chromobacterium sphagni]